MIPEESLLYRYELRTVDASYPRAAGAVLLEKPLNKISDNTLKICYRKYTSSRSSPSGTNLNLVFFHGTGMNKGLWHYHIDKLYTFFNGEKDNNTDLHLNTVLAFDAVNHGDSAALNNKKLGTVYDWRDNGKDVVKVLQEDELDTFLGPGHNLNIMIGHSMGGFVTLYSAFLCPTLFDSCIILNPVCFADPSVFDLRNSEFRKWYQRGFMKDEFDIPEDSNWKKETDKFFTKKSFFRGFKPPILQNMLEDETPDEIKQNPNKHHKKVNLKTTVVDQLNTYFGLNESVYQSMPTYESIEVPIFHIVGEFDTSKENSVNTTRTLLKKVVRPIDLPNSRHLVNAEDPDTVIKLFTLIIQQREVVNSKMKIIDEKYLSKKYGDNYRKVLSDAMRDTITKNNGNAPKL